MSDSSTALDQEFDNLKDQVKSLMVHAAECITRADQLVKSSGFITEPNLIDHEIDTEVDENGDVSIRLYHSEFWDAVRPLMNSISEAGWSASSMSC